jgi:serine/threonine-protein kinase
MTAGPTATFHPQGAADETATASGGPAPAASPFDEELRQLLRYRLLLVHLLALAFMTLLAVLVFVIPRQGQGLSAAEITMLWLMLPAVLESVIGVVVLRRWPGVSLGALRQWELLFFAVQTALAGYGRFDMLMRADRVTIPFAGIASLQMFITLILAYGVLIPNTRRRSVLVVAGLVTVAFAVIPAGFAVNPDLREVEVAPSIVQCALVLIVPMAIALFAASRASALQRRAFEAERRAEQVGQYALKRKLGEGGMGEVWLAEHRLIKRPCAVKFVRADLAAHPATAARFEREVRAVTGLTHFNTVRVYDYGRADDGSFYYVMEYLDGPTLDRLVRDQGPLEPGRVVHLLRQLCGALAEAHAAGLVHRDVKPGNVIVATLGGQPDTAKLLDFGLVQDLSTAADGRLTRAGVVLGTPAYMCPEQAGGGGAVDARGDVYSLGAVAFFALSGRPPFERETVGQFIAAHLTQSPPDVTEVRKDVPADLAAVVARCLAKDPAGRFQSAAELDDALAGCGCAADWSARAARLRTATGTDGEPAGREPTRTCHAEGGG